MHNPKKLLNSNALKKSEIHYYILLQIFLIKSGVIST